MNNYLIYGIMNEDREIVWVNIFEPIDWDPDRELEQDALWKCFIDDCSMEVVEIIDAAQWDRDYVILETIPMNEATFDEATDLLMEWVHMIQPRYNKTESKVNEDGTVDIKYIWHRTDEVENYRYSKEKEWEEEDRELLGERAYKDMM